MTWTVTTPAGPVSSDDFTLGDLDDIEKGSDTFWSVANPWRHARVARGFLRAAYRAKGLDPGLVDSLTMGALKTAFDYEPDPGDEAADPTRGRRGRSTRASSAPSSKGSAGRPRSAGSSDSET